MSDPTRAELRSFIEACPIALLEFDDAGRVRFMNPIARGFLRAAAPDADPEDFFAVMDRHFPDLRSAIAAFAEPAGEIGERRRLIVTLDDGSECAVTMRIVRVEPGRHHCLMADVTPFLHEQRRRIAAEGRLADILESIRDYAIYTLDLDGQIDAWNRSGERLHHFGAEEAEGRTLDLLYAEENEQPLDPAVLLAEVHRGGSSRVEGWWRRRRGGPFWGDTLITLLRGEGQAIYAYSVVTRDLSAQRAAEEHLRQIADTDSLTGLATRRAFETAAERALGERTTSGRPVSLVLLDLDDFKDINDTRGHAVGDACLRRVADILAEAVRDNDLIGRIGGDELAILLPSANTAEALVVGERVHRMVAETPIEEAGPPIRLTVSLGIAEAAPGEMLKTLMARADAALYRAKERGRDRVVVA